LTADETWTRPSPDASLVSVAPSVTGRSVVSGLAAPWVSSISISALRVG